MRETLVAMSVAAMTGGVGCASAPTTPPPATATEPSTPAQLPVTAGIRLQVADAPTGATLRAYASDDRPPLLQAQPLLADQQLALEPGFVELVLAADGVERVVQLYLRGSAQVELQWPSATPVSLSGAEILDRARAEADAKRDFDALMEAAKAKGDPDALPSRLAEQAQAVLELPDSTYADLRRLLHAANAIQIEGPDAAWGVIAPIAADSPAWAAFAPHVLELRALFGQMPRAEARFAQVRVAVADAGLAAALAAGDQMVADAAPGDRPANRAVVDATHFEGAPVVGAAMPRFEMVGLDGTTPVRSADLAGKPYVLELWSTWCKPCLKQMKALHRLHEDVGDRLQIVSVTINGSAEAAKGFRAERWPMPWTHAWVPGGEPLFARWGIDQVPFAVLVDAQGIVLAAGRHVDLADVAAAVPLDVRGCPGHDVGSHRRTRGPSQRGRSCVRRRQGPPPTGRGLEATPRGAG